MPATYEPIATVTLGSAQNSISFTSIPQTYTDLRLIFRGRGSGGNDFYLRYNGDASPNYGAQGIGRNHSQWTNVNFSSNTGRINPGIYHNTTIATYWSIDIFNYTNTVDYKVSLHSINGEYDGLGYDGVFIGNQIYVANTNAITRVDVLTGSGATWSTGAMATLYGILKA